MGKSNTFDTYIIKYIIELQMSSDDEMIKGKVIGKKLFLLTGDIHPIVQCNINGLEVTYVTDESGNGHSQSGSYTRTDGTTLSVEDVWFEKDASNTVVNDSTGQIMLDETDDITGLPDIQGRGNQYSLHQAMVRDETSRVYREVAA